MTQLPNQFSMTPEKGALTLDPNWSTLNTQVSENEAGTLVVGQAVLLEDALGSQIPVTVVSAITDAIFGFIPYNTRTDEYVAFDNVKVARKGDVMLMEAGGAIARGAELEIVIAGNKVVTQATGTTIGKALDKATADGDLIRVEILV